VVAELAATGTVVSIDTMRPRVAAEAVARGARLINDVSGGQADPDMLPLVAGLGLPYLCMHWRGHSTDMQSRATYGDVVADVIAELGRQVDSVLEAGITKDRLIVDPGFGYAKTGEHNWQLLQRIDELAALDVPVLAGVSRKAFLGTLLAGPDGSPRQPKDRDDATVALTTLLASRGIWAVRVHSVRASRDAIAVVDRMAAS
jgi:dihydropteroate synthase